jgi:NADPH-dependent curcumin reductase CurA
VGQALAHLAPPTGAARIIGTVGSPQRVASARAAGYDAVLVRDDGLAQALREETGGRGADVILDPQGTGLLELDLDLAAPGARIVLFGNAAGGQLGPLPPPGALFARNAMIGGFSLSRMATQLPERLAGALRDVLKRLATGALDVELHELDGLESAPCPANGLISLYFEPGVVLRSPSGRAVRRGRFRSFQRLRGDRTDSALSRPDCLLVLARGNLDWQPEPSIGALQPTTGA